MRASVVKKFCQNAQNNIPEVLKIQIFPGSMPQDLPTLLCTKRH